MKTNFLTSLILLLIGITVSGCEEQEDITRGKSNLTFQMEDNLLLSLENDDALHLEGLCLQMDLMDKQNNTIGGLISACTNTIKITNDNMVLGMQVYITTDDGEIETQLSIQALPDGDHPGGYLLHTMSNNDILSGSEAYEQANGKVEISGILRATSLSQAYIRCDVTVAFN